MGREVRRVPLSWQHPKNEDGYFIPLHRSSLASEVADWDEGARRWEEGFWCDYLGEWHHKADDQTGSYEEWHGASRPDLTDYMPQWPESECIGWQWYETVTEGTPISPVFAKPEWLACWLTWFGHRTEDCDYGYEEWLEIITSGKAIPSFYLQVPKMRSLTASSGCGGDPILYAASEGLPRIPIFDEILSVFGMGHEAFLMPGMSTQGSSAGETHGHPCGFSDDHCRHSALPGKSSFWPESYCIRSIPCGDRYGQIAFIEPGFGKDSMVMPETHRYPRSQAPWAPPDDKLSPMERDMLARIVRMSQRPPPLQYPQL